MKVLTKASYSSAVTDRERENLQLLHVFRELCRILIMTSLLGLWPYIALQDDIRTDLKIYIQDRFGHHIIQLLFLG